MRAIQKMLRAVRVWLVMVLMAAGVLLSTSSHATRVPAYTIAPIGPLQICAVLDQAGKAMLTARSARGCMSSSCRGFVRSSLQAVLEKTEIRLTGELFHRKPKGRMICTRDCRGARTIPVPLNGLGPGRFTVRHNGQLYGILDLMRGGKRVCVSGTPARRQR